MQRRRSPPYAFVALPQAKNAAPEISQPARFAYRLNRVPSWHTFVVPSFWAHIPIPPPTFQDSPAKPSCYLPSTAWHGSCDSVNAGGRGAVSQRFHACVREMTPHAYPIDSRYGDAAEPPPLAGGDRRPGFGPGRVHPRQGCGRHHQDRRPAFAFGHHGHQRNHAERYGPFPDRRAEQEGRRSRQEARGCGRGPRIELAAVRRKGPRAHHQEQGLRGVRLLDLGVAQIRAAGVQGTEFDTVLSGAVRGRGERAQRVLHRCCAEPAGDPGGRLPDEGRKGETLGAGRYRLRLSAHHQQDSRSLLEVEGRQAGRHHDQLHAVRS